MGKLEKSLAEMFSFIFQGDSEYEIYTFPAVILGFAVKAVCGEGKVGEAPRKDFQCSTGILP